MAGQQLPAARWEAPALDKGQYLGSREDSPRCEVGAEQDTLDTPELSCYSLEAYLSIYPLLPPGRTFCWKKSSIVEYGEKTGIWTNVSHRVAVGGPYNQAPRIRS